MKKKLVKKIVRKRKADPENQMCLLLRALTEYYKTDALAPGITLAHISDGIYADLKTQWYGSINRYVRREKETGIRRATIHKFRGPSIDGVMQGLAQAWYTEVTSQVKMLGKYSALKGPR
jgi:hypothetical protein